MMEFQDISAVVFRDTNAISDDEINAIIRKYAVKSLRILPLNHITQLIPARGDPLAHVYGYVGEGKGAVSFLDFSQKIFQQDPRPYFFMVTKEQLPMDDIVKKFSGHLIAFPGDRSVVVENHFFHALQKVVLQESMTHWFHQWDDLKKSGDEANTEAYRFQQEQNEVIRFTKVLAEKLVSQDVAQSACHFMSELFKAAAVGFMVYDEITDTLRLEHATRTGQLQALNKGVDVGLRGKRNGVEHFESFVKDKNLKDLMANDFPALRISVYPVYIKKQVLGIFFLGFQEHDEVVKAHVLSQLIQYFSVSYQNATLHGEITNLATRDGLTKLHNVRYFHERIAAEFNRMERLKHPLGLIFLDIDNFKQYNDTHGHPMGDKVIKQTADLIKSVFRPTDIIARYGGEEFVIAMPHSNMNGALKRAQELRELIERTPYPNEETQPLGKVTVSVGVSAFPEIANDVKALLQTADDALYKVKQGGRNNVRNAQPPSGHLPLFDIREDYHHEDLVLNKK